MWCVIVLLKVAYKAWQVSQKFFFKNFDNFPKFSHTQKLSTRILVVHPTFSDMDLDEHLRYELLRWRDWSLWKSPFSTKIDKGFTSFGHIWFHEPKPKWNSACFPMKQRQKMRRCTPFFMYSGMPIPLHKWKTPCKKCFKM